MLPTLPADSRPAGRVFVWTWLGCVAFVSLVLFPAGTLALLNWFDDPTLRWIAEIRERKLRMAERVESGGRILIAGGSSALFTLDAELLEAKLGRPAINLATHGGLRLGFLLGDARRVARAGDVILLHLEYEQYRGREEIGEIERKFVWTHAPSQFLRLEPRAAARQIYGNPFSDYVRSWESWNMRLRGELQRAEPDVWQNYSFVCLGPRGDFRGPLRFRARIEAKTFPHEAVTASAADELREFVAWCRAREIGVLTVLPAVRRSAPAERAQMMSAAAQVRGFMMELGTPVFGDPAVLQFPAELFSDTVYHANSVGRRLRTEALAPELAAHFGKPLPLGESGIFLMGDREAPWERALVSASRGLDYRYLTEEDLAHPWCVTPEQVRGLAQDGVRLRYADAKADALLARAGLTADLVEERTSTLHDWAQRFPRHVFLLATSGAPNTFAWAEAAPEPFRKFLQNRSQSRAAILGLGPYSGVKAFAVGEVDATAKQPRRKSWQTAFALELRAMSVSALPYPGQRGPIMIERETLLDGRADSVAVAVVDPSLGIVVARGHFIGGRHLEFELKQIRAAAP